MTTVDQLQLVWPLTFLLVALLLLRKMEARINPIVDGITNTLATDATRYATAWMMGAIYAGAASCQALGEVARQFEWIYVEAVAKVLQPGLVAIIAYVTRSPSQNAQKADTKPPFAGTPNQPPS